MDDTLNVLFTALRVHYGQARSAIRARRAHGSGDDGVSTLEMAIIALGLMAIAGVLVAVLVTAVNSRTSKIK